MTQHDDSLIVRQMLDHAREAVAMSDQRRREDLRDDRMLELALTRLVEIVGEAAGRTTEAFRKKHPSIPWRQAVGMRNRLIHGYDAVDLDVLWDTVRVDFPPLIEALEKVATEP